MKGQLFSVRDTGSAVDCLYKGGQIPKYIKPRSAQLKLSRYFIVFYN